MKDSIEGMRSMYRPIITDYFKDFISQSNDTIYLNDNPKMRADVYEYIADNIYHNMERVSAVLYDKSK